ncbi:MAG TPA: alpha/beta hydrolase fold domain-containing protein [Candidatus Bathyarchaeia archaeon]|nr:alpha/beta hydrolase fold domain-containing protein [Candidatus Bathyarchaeia archaeon]
MKLSRTAFVAMVAVSGALLCAAQADSKNQAGDEKKLPPVVVQADGTVELPAESVPLSKFLSPEGKAYLNQHLHDMQDPEKLKQDDGVPRFMMGYLERQKALYDLKMEDTKIAGVHVYVFMPTAGVAAKNKDRVLINLHGGGFSGCWPGCAELESRPMAGVGKYKVVSVDYREGPDNKFPAASEDVASVYMELLKTHKPENIGIYGCSAGGMLTAQSVAWFVKHHLPLPGAIGIYCASAGGFGGDAEYTSTPLGEARFMPPMDERSMTRLGYFSGVDPKNPLVTPVNSPEILAKFPPTLLITGTRGFEMSSALYTHSQLVKLGVEADLHVWEGMFHGFYYNVDVPESQEAINVMVKFFDKHLGTK